MDISRRAVGTAAIGTVVATSSLAVAERANAQASTESTFDRVKQSKVLRVAALPGESPYFNKNVATSEWTGMAVEMAKNSATSIWSQPTATRCSICKAARSTSPSPSIPRRSARW